MAEFPTEEEIVRAVERSGYLMEQDVASKFENLGYFVETNTAYEDKDEGKSRELDVKAFKRIAFDEDRKISAAVEFLVECKNNSSATVFIGRNKNHADAVFHRRPEFYFPVEEYQARKQLLNNQTQIKYKTPFEHLGLDKVHYRSTDKQKVVQFCRIDRSGKTWRADHGGLYDSLFFPMAKALISRRADLPHLRKSTEWRYLWFFIPLVVLNGPILYIDSTKKPTVAEKRSHASFSRQIRSSTLKDKFTLDFVQLDALENFHSDCIEPLQARMKDLVEKEIDFMLQDQIEWF